MSVTGKRRLPSVIEAAIAGKLDIKEVTAETLRSDAAAILEAVVAEFDEQAVVSALDNQGFDGKSYRSTLRALVDVAQQRRSARLAGSTGPA